MRIVHVAAEFSPIAKAGGLGEVVVGLCRELSQFPELEVEIYLPKYDLIDSEKLSDLQMEIADFKCFEKNHFHSNTLWSAQCENSRLQLIEPHHPSQYFQRGKIYGCEDDLARFIYFCKSVIEALKLKNQPIDILHLHDWHAALCAPLVREVFQKELSIKAIVLTLHNAEYQGKCACLDLDAIGMQGSDFLTADKLQDNDPKYPQTINLLKGGIVYADAVNTVSITYAKEILTPEKGFGLDPTFRQYQSKLSGILNGIDQTLWNPKNDPYVTPSYDAEQSMATILAAKKKQQTLLSKKFGLARSKGPWLGTITRIVPQKGPELIEEALAYTVQNQGTFILLGSSPIPQLQAHFEQLKEKYAAHRCVLLHLTYDEALAHQIYAALDLLIVPSHFEPCGLSQLIAMRYGTVPIVHATGGLKDTVFDCEDSLIPAKSRNGFTFQGASSGPLKETLRRAFHLFQTDPTTFQVLMRRGMQLNFSWEKPTQEYLKLYRKATLQSKRLIA